MSLSDPLLSARITFLLLGGVLSLIASVASARRAYALPRSEFRNFFIEFAVATALLGIVMLGFGFGDIFKYGSSPNIGFIVTSASSIAGVVGIFFFVHAMYKFSKYIRGLGA